jgi:hypothetical protein
MIREYPMHPKRPFTLAISVAALIATPVLVLVASIGLGVEPSRANAYDPPSLSVESEHISAVVRGCAEAGGRSETRIQAGVFVVSCDMTLGMGPAVARRVR